MEADMQCTDAIHSMERKLRTACHSADAKLELVLKVIVSAALLTSIFSFFVLWTDCDVLDQYVILFVCLSLVVSSHVMFIKVKSFVAILLFVGHLPAYVFMYTATKDWDEN